MSEDRQLLRAYTEQGSRQALEELIQRHFGLVYSSALRQVRDPHLAEDVSQAVFLVLTQKARSIRHATALGGWLLSVTRCVVVNAMRKQINKNKCEHLAAKPEALQAAADEWGEIAPLLDAELNRLKTADRDALVLRFFEDRSFAEIGAELGLSEDAARKRVTRALERLRARLEDRKISITAGTLGLAIGAYAVQAAPAHLPAGTIAANVAHPTPQIISLTKGALKMLAYAKAKLIGTVAASLVLGGTGIVVSHNVFARAGHEPSTVLVASSQGLATARPADGAPAAATAKPTADDATINMDEPLPGDLESPNAPSIVQGGAGSITLVTVGPQLSRGAVEFTKITPGAKNPSSVVMTGANLGATTFVTVGNPNTSRPAGDGIGKTEEK
ncbi:MAG TPA: sigma-70 family RNA polymerase sigma factor [Pirellulales bacterium]|nr:sigma-70 family RNA polymerase sigma factor [Pirellulales bacterium]